MAKRVYFCGICEGVNFAYTCAACVNFRLNDKYRILLIQQQKCGSLRIKLDKKLMSKCKADEREYVRHIQEEKLLQLKERLHFMQTQLLKVKEKLEEKKKELRARSSLLEGASHMLQKKRMEHLKYVSDQIHTQSLSLTSFRLELLTMQSVVIKHLMRIFPIRRVAFGKGKRDTLGIEYDEICKVRLPRGLDPHSVPADELSASLGYMLQLLNLVASYLYAPLLLSSGFAVSCSRVWQRASYWDDRPASQSQEHPLFIPRQNSMVANQEGSSNFGIASMESPRVPNIDYGSSSSSFNNGSNLTRSLDMEKDVQKGILLLKKSVACVTAYCFNAFYRSTPTEFSTFDAFGKMLIFLSSKEARTLLSSKESKSRSKRQLQQSSMLVQDHISDSKLSTCSLEESKLRKAELKFSARSGLSHTSFVCANEVSESGKIDSFDGWDIVEHPRLPPPPSHTEDVEHWTRAMILDAKKL